MAETRDKKTYLPAEETSLFCEQITLILKGGIPLFDGVETICKTYGNTRYGDVFKRLEETMATTGSLGKAVEAAAVFPPYMERMVNIGEASGKLDDVMEALSEYYAREGKIQMAVRNAVVYPAALLVMMAVVIVVLVSQVLPIFDRVFRNLGSSMDASMAVVMNVGTMIGYVMLGLLGVLLVGGIIIFVLYRMGRADGITAWFQAHFPPIRRIMEKTSASRFASVISIMMAAGYPISEAIEMTPSIVTDKATRAKLETVAKEVRENTKDLPQAIADAKIFDPLYTRMIEMGYKAGQMDRVLSRLSDVLEDEVDVSIRSLVNKVEPTLVAILAIVIGGILLAVMLPLASVMTSIL